MRSGPLSTTGRLTHTNLPSPIPRHPVVPIQKARMGTRQVRSPSAIRKMVLPHLCREREGRLESDYPAILPHATAAHVRICPSGQTLAGNKTITRAARQLASFERRRGRIHNASLPTFMPAITHQNHAPKPNEAAYVIPSSQGRLNGTKELILVGPEGFEPPTKGL